MDAVLAQVDLDQVSLGAAQYSSGCDSEDFPMTSYDLGAVAWADVEGMLLEEGWKAPGEVAEGEDPMYTIDRRPGSGQAYESRGQFVVSAVIN